MNYRLSEEYLKKRKRGMSISTGMFVAVSVVLSSIGVATANYAMLIGLVFLVMAWQTYSSMKRWMEISTKIEFGIEGSKLVIQGEFFRNEVSLSSVKKMVLQMRKARVLSVLLYSESGPPERFEGIENIQSFANEIEAVIGSGRVKHARFFHR